MKRQAGFSLLEVLVAILVTTMGFAGVVLWLTGHARAMQREQSRWVVLRAAHNAYERAMANPEQLRDTSWEAGAGELAYHVKLDVFDSSDAGYTWSASEWPREARLRICLVRNSADCPVDWFLAVGGGYAGQKP